MTTVSNSARRGIAVVGASERNFWARAAIANVRAYGYPGQIWPVNPNYSEVLGFECYPSLQALPGHAEAALLAVAANRCAGIVADAVAASIPHIIVISDGFAERGRKDLQDELVALVAGTNSRLYGPNCVGFLDMVSGLCAVGEPIPMNLRPGPVSFISQSGALLSAFMSACVEEGLGLDWCISVGNGADVDVARAVAIAVERPTTHVVCVYAENLGRNAKDLGDALDRALELGKWVALLKVGASRGASRIALSHTGSMVGPDRFVSAFLESHGALRVGSVEELVRVASVCSIVKGRPSGGVAVVGSSGGTASMVSDAALDLGLRLAKMTQGTDAYLRQAAPVGSFLDNPFDITGRPGARVGMEEMWRHVFSDPNVSFVVAPHTVVYPDESDGRAVHRDSMLLYQRLGVECGKPTAGVSLGVQTWTDWVERLRDAHHPGYVVVRGLGTTLQALAKVFPASNELIGARDLAPPDAEVARLLTEDEGRDILIRCSLPVVRGRTFPSPDAVTTDGLRFPIAVKIVAAGVTHKARIGGVRLGCVSEDEVRMAAQQVLEAVLRAGVAVESTRGIRIEEMVNGPEILVGLQRDPELGSYLTLGLGGRLTEAAHSTRTVMLPTTHHDVTRQLRETHLLTAITEQAPQVVDLIAKLASEFSDGRLRDFSTVEVNPMIVTSDGPQIADVMIIR